VRQYGRRRTSQHPKSCTAPSTRFNPDEEIGRGTGRTVVDELAADVAYTLDSEHPGEIDYELSAERAVVTFTGVAAHPG
jgi:di/tripeptidase